MNILRLVGEVFLLYLLYKLRFDFIIPIYRTTKQVKKGFREMHERMNDQMNQQQGFQNPTSTTKAKSEKPGEYIDFEEIK